LDAFTLFSRPAVIAVGLPVMILAGVATYFNSRASVARQSPEAAANPQTAMMNKLALYVFPLGVVVGGPFLPLAIILYWFANNIWTFGQQHYVFGMIEKEDEAKKQEVIERRAANAPAPGAKPKRNPKTAPPGGNGSAKADADAPNPAETDSDVADGPAPGADDGSSNRTPRPGARPKKRKR
jgi:YidC/Oxa1 family membrane protein insertase